MVTLFSVVLFLKQFRFGQTVNSNTRYRILMKDEWFTFLNIKDVVFYIYANS